jgi:hypothetical protein
MTYRELLVQMTNEQLDQTVTVEINTELIPIERADTLYDSAVVDSGQLVLIPLT